MGGVFTYLLQNRIVRVFFVPTMMALMLYVLYRLAAPPEGNDEDAPGRGA